MLAYCSAFKVPVTPFGAVNLTKELVVAKVSSKSNIVIPLLSLTTLLPFATALENEKIAAQKAERLMSMMGPLKYGRPEILPFSKYTEKKAFDIARTAFQGHPKIPIVPGFTDPSTGRPSQRLVDLLRNTGQNSFLFMYDYIDEITD